jgi:multiple sugar transport system substrate-binding protein
MRNGFAGICATAMVGLFAWQAQALELVIWHDKGDDGLKMISEMAAIYKQTNPDITIRSLSFPTEQWFSKTIAALNTGTSPDIIFNDDSRIVRIQQTTGKLTDVKPDIEALSPGDRQYITDGDIRAGTLEGKTLMMPFQRTVAGWGVRKSWLDKVGEKPPVTMEDAIRVAQKFQTQDPDGNGKADTYGMAWQAGDAPSMFGGGINLLVFGNLMQHSLIDDGANIVIEEPVIKKATIEYLKLFTTYKLVAPDTINHTFTDMYQLIEGGRAGMFRVGNWNVKKWDNEAIKGDYTVLPFPGMSDGKGAMVIGSVRGMAVPTNAPNVAEARKFLAFLVTQAGQQRSLENMGGVVRTDLDTSRVTPGLKPFIDKDTKLGIADSMTAQYPWYPALQDAYYRKLTAAIAAPPSDWDVWFKATADELRAEVVKLKAKG